MLDIEGFESGYGESRVLFGLSLSVKAGEVVTMIGRNGMGKTTTVHTLMGIVRPNKGVALFDGKPIQGLPPYEIARRGLGLVPEGRRISPNLSVEENLVATARKNGAWSLDKVYLLFPRLKERRRSMGLQLSGGEQQMLAIGRALMTNPKLLVLDEATEGLAPLIRAEIWNCLVGLKRQGQAILVIDKNIDALTRIADRHYIIEKGRAVWSGSNDALCADAALRQRYLGV